MKKKNLFTSLSAVATMIFFVVFLSSCTKEGPLGSKDGGNGIKGMNGKTILTGLSNPNEAIGTEGNYYVNSMTYRMFGPKVGKSWGTGRQMITGGGPVGGVLAFVWKITIEPAGANCALGGKKIEKFTDTNSDGVWDAGDVTTGTITYECNSVSAHALVKVSTELAGANCANGGTKLESGVDANNNLVLEAWEVFTTNYACNSVDGVDGANGADGVDGNTILNGAAVPTTEGVDGDFYLQIPGYTLYGPKTAGAWGTGMSLVGPAGADANESCKECHNASIVEAKAGEFKLSKHEFGIAAEEEAGVTSCSPCHQGDGMKYVVENNVSTVFTNSAGTWTNPYSVPQAYTYGGFACNTCHKNLHTAYAYTDIDNANLANLTTRAAVPMTMWGGALTIDLTQNDGESNLCVRCHQPRPLTRSNLSAATGNKSNVLDYADLVNNPTATFWDDNTANTTTNPVKPGYRTHVHYGAVGAIFAGKGAIEYAGSVPYIASEHSTIASCQDCHMATMKGAAGGHSFNAKGNLNGCSADAVNCHTSSAASTLKTAKNTEVKQLLADLEAKLQVGGVWIMNRNLDSETNLWYGITAVNNDGYLNIYDASSNPSGPTYNAFQFYNPSYPTGTTPTSTWTTSAIAYNNTLPHLTLQNVQMGAIINYQMCLREYSLGIHNPNYSVALLTNTIEALTAAGF